MVRINNVTFGNKMFPNRERVYVEVPLSSESNTIQFLWESDSDIGVMLMAIQYIRNNVPDTAKLNLEMPYIPYSAMDRWINDQIPSAIYFARFVNDLGFDEISVLDPHSQVVMTQLGFGKANIIQIDLQSIIDKVISDVSPDFVYYPDKGAYSKYPNIIDTHGIRSFHGYKHRDLANKGKLSPEMQVDLCGIEARKLNGSKVLIIDDICRKGGTAYYAAKNLKQMGVAEVYLYVSHCEDCIEQGEIFNTDEINRVYTTDSEYQICKVADRQPKLVIIKEFYTLSTKDSKE